MIILVGGGATQLRDLDDLSSFKIVMTTPRSSPDLSAALDGVGAFDGSAVWVFLAWIRAQASDQSAEWFERFDRMLAFARSKGWLDDAAQTVRGHVEPLD